MPNKKKIYVVMVISLDGGESFCYGAFNKLSDATKEFDRAEEQHQNDMFTAIRLFRTDLS